MQLKEKVIPTFEGLHGAGYQALFLIDNSQGHSAYAVDALLVSCMNVNSGGKQARMQDGWYMQDGVKVYQSMVFSENHTDHPNQPKGIKAVLMECGIYQPQLHGKCQSQCEHVVQFCAATSGYWSFNLTFKPKSHLSRRLLKLLVTCASFS